MPKCVKCQGEVEELSPEGECFCCSTGDNIEDTPITTKNIRECMHNVATGLAVKTDLLTKEAKLRMHEAVKAKNN